MFRCTQPLSNSSGCRRSTIYIRPFSELEDPRKAASRLPRFLSVMLSGFCRADYSLFLDCYPEFVVFSAFVLHVRFTALPRRGLSFCAFSLPGCSFLSVKLLLPLLARSVLIIQKQCIVQRPAYFLNATAILLRRPTLPESHSVRTELPRDLHLTDPLSSSAHRRHVFR